METIKHETIFSEDDLQTLFAALTLYIRNSDFKQEGVEHVEDLWHKLRWAIWLHKNPHLLTQHAADVAVCPTCELELSKDGICPKCFGCYPPRAPWWMSEGEYITDGWAKVSAYCSRCGQKTMQVVRPGNFQCASCDDRPAANA